MILSLRLWLQALSSRLFSSNQSGGWRYHLRAYRFRETLWKPFRDEISLFLKAWDPSQTKILVLGPSAGHCLDFLFLNKFEKITLVDIDPIAPVLFLNRWKSLGLDTHKVHWIRADALGVFSHDLNTLRHLLQLHTEEALLFSNLLGQILCLVEDPKTFPFEEFYSSLNATLTGRTWASFHDRASYQGPWNSHFKKLPTRIHYSKKRLTVEQLLPIFAKAKAPITIVDHETQLCPAGTAFSYWHWPLTPHDHHWIEGTFVR